MTDLSEELSPELNLAAKLVMLIGLCDLLAAVVIFLPMTLIYELTRHTGMEPLPAIPIADYLVRIAAAMYALFGGMLVFLSSDIVRYRPAVRFLGMLAIIHGGVVFAVDSVAGMPVWWRWSEGPVFGLIGVLLIILCRPNQSPN